MTDDEWLKMVTRCTSPPLRRVEGPPQRLLFTDPDCENRAMTVIVDAYPGRLVQIVDIRDATDEEWQTCDHLGYLRHLLKSRKDYGL